MNSPNIMRAAMFSLVLAAQFVGIAAGIEWGAGSAWEPGDLASLIVVSAAFIGCSVGAYMLGWLDALRYSGVGSRKGDER